MTSLFPRSNEPSEVQSVSFERYWSKLTLEVKIKSSKNQAQNFAREVLSKHTFKAEEKKGSKFVIRVAS